MSIPQLLHTMCAELSDVDQTFAANRQRFLTEQGYKYEILYENEVL
jgi:hypothetical protein